MHLPLGARGTADLVHHVCGPGEARFFVDGRELDHRAKGFKGRAVRPCVLSYSSVNEVAVRMVKPPYRE